MSGAIEKKVGYPAGAGTVVALVLGLNAAYHWFTPPPVPVTSLAVTVLAGMVGWLAPHTHAPLKLTAREAKAAAEAAGLDTSSWSAQSFGYTSAEGEGMEYHPLPAPFVMHQGDPGTRGVGVTSVPTPDEVNDTGVPHTFAAAGEVRPDPVRAAAGFEPPSLPSNVASPAIQPPSTGTGGAQ